MVGRGQPELFRVGTGLVLLPLLGTFCVWTFCSSSSDELLAIQKEPIVRIAPKGRSGCSCDECSLDLNVISISFCFLSIADRRHCIAAPRYDFSNLPGRRALESPAATTFAIHLALKKGRIAAFEFFFFGCLELREFKYFEIGSGA